jgi:hypothetical protein
MKITNREELEAALKEYDTWEWKYRQEHLPSMHKEKENCRRAILDALFPKPESERLRQLKEIKSTWGDVRGLALDKDALVLELIDAAIREEEPKQ